MHACHSSRLIRQPDPIPTRRPALREASRPDPGEVRAILAAILARLACPEAGDGRFDHRSPQAAPAAS